MILFYSNPCKVIPYFWVLTLNIYVVKWDEGAEKVAGLLQRNKENLRILRRDLPLIYNCGYQSDVVEFKKCVLIFN